MLQSSKLEAIEYRGMALRLAAALEGLCNEAERRAINVTYWRDMAADVRERAK